MLNAFRYAEADRILVLLTKDRGRFGAIAKSARKCNSSLSGASEPFVHAKYELAPGRSLAIVRSAEIIDPHLAIRESWTNLQLAGHISEIASMMGVENHPDTELYEITLRAFREVNLKTPHAVLMYKLRLLDILGISPHIDNCLECGAKRVKGKIHLHQSKGGFVCSSCAKRLEIYHPIPMEALYIIKAVKDNSQVPELPDNLFDIADDLATNLLQSFLQKGFRTYPAVRHVREAVNIHNRNNKSGERHHDNNQ